MSATLNFNTKKRPYKIEVFGLQDNFIGVLQTYEDRFLGQVIEPNISIKKDGTQTFECRIPKFFLSEISNQKVINPRWEDVEKGIIAENTCVIKITIDFDGEVKTYPFIIDKIVNKRETDFSVYKEITGNGLAFAELGKIGYKLELNSHTLEEDFKKDPNTVANINYWLDKIFPNKKNENGKVIQWLTPWCYEIRMDWRSYLNSTDNTYLEGGNSVWPENYTEYFTGDSDEILDDANVIIDAGGGEQIYELLDSGKIYEKPYVADWKVSNGKIQPIAINSLIEKARYIDCHNSNKYNITQTLAENFEVFCAYEYACDTNGYFKKTYVDDNGKIWTGKKVVFFNKTVKTDNPFVLNYERNLQSIKRIIDSSEIYTKMYVTPISSEVMDTGYISIASTTANPLLDDYILNFDYLHSVGSISDWQMEEIERFKVKIHNYNKKLIELENNYNNLIVELNNLEANYTTHENQLSSAREQLVNYQRLRDSEITNTPVIKDEYNTFTTILVPQPSSEIVMGQLRLEGINPSSIIGYSNYDYKTELFNAENLVFVQGILEANAINENKWYIISDEYGFPKSIFTSRNNKIFGPAPEGVFGENFNINTGAIVYLKLEYNPKNKYSAICESFEKLISRELIKLEELSFLIGNADDINEEKWTGLKKEIALNEQEREKIQAQKEESIFNLERILGPALREGYWQPDNYEDPGQGYQKEISYSNDNIKEENASFIFDELSFPEEQKEYYYNNPQNITEEGKVYYSFIDLSNIYPLITYEQKNPLDSFCINLLHPIYKWQLQNNNELISNSNYYFLLDGKYYTFNTPENSFLNKDIVILNTKTNNNKIAPYISITREDEILYDYIPTVQSDNKPDSTKYYNITNAFFSINSYLSKRQLYNNAGFCFSFFKDKNTGKIIPVALLQNENINYSDYTTILCSFDNNETLQEIGKIESNNGDYNIVYPRIFLDHNNVNYDSDVFTLENKKDNQYNVLSNFEDYMILLRKGKVYVTLKTTNANIPYQIINGSYRITYQVSRANEMLYLDAVQVAKDNSKPKYSYEITKANLPEEVNSVELGQLVYISDYNVDIHKEYGYISEINLKLDKPSNDSLVVENYKTKFEDLFASITVQNEAMKQNQNLYNIAAASFTPSGQVKQETLQETLDNNDFIFNFSNTNMILDNTGGLVLTNTEPYNNGIYGQVALRGGGLFLSNEINREDNSRIWSTAITPEGINANLVTTGRLDTSLIRILSGDKPNFIWKAEGLYAYKEIVGENNQVTYDENNYIRFNEDGLFYVNDNIPCLQLGWNGLEINLDNGHVKINSKGLQILENNNPIVIVGKDTNIEASPYGFFLYRYEETNGNLRPIQTLKATTSGYLTLTDKLLLGYGENNNYVGLSGSDEYVYESNDYVRFWAGAQEPNNANLIITENGVLQGNKIIIPSGGAIVFKKSDDIAGEEDIILDYEKVKLLLTNS